MWKTSSAWNHQSVRRLGLALVLALASACGPEVDVSVDGGTIDGAVDGGPTSDGGVDPGECTVITPGMFTLFSDRRTYSVVQASFTPDIGLPNPDQLIFELFSSHLRAPHDGEVPGTYDFATGRDSNYSTCSRCLLLARDMDSPTAMQPYYPRSGTITLTQQGTGMMGTLTNVTMGAVYIDPDSSVSTPLPGGPCVFIPSALVTAIPQPRPLAGQPEGWTCDPTWVDDGDCDCGCGAVDTDCQDANISSCEVCGLPGMCGTDNECSDIDPTNNAVCIE